MLIAGSTLSQIVNSVNEGRVEAILEGKTELEAIWVPGLLDKHLKESIYLSSVRFP